MRVFMSSTDSRTARKSLRHLIQLLADIGNRAGQAVLLLLHVSLKPLCITATDVLVRLTLSSVCCVSVWMAATF